VDYSQYVDRLNILFDNGFVSKYKTAQQLLDSVLLPIGNFVSPYINWSQVSSSNDYSQFQQLQMNRLMAENTRVYPHVQVMDENGEYYSSTEMERDDKFISLSVENRFNELILSGHKHTVNGVWEEIHPHSDQEQFNVNGLGSIQNSIYDFIYQDSRKIGIQIKSVDAITQLACRYCEGATVWGLYNITFPSYSSTIESTIYFIPIGKIDNDVTRYLPPAELIKMVKFK
jgi:hypothetical protein